MSIKVSVIIPVYNAGKYITQCVESLLNQTLEQCEFIFINDGSTDNSREIIEGYKELDCRIILINQENQGVSIARNKGLSVATGEYVGFVDADDYIERKMYEILYNSAKQDDCDVVISNINGEMEGHKVAIRYPFPVDTVLKKEYIYQELLPYFLKTDHLNTAVNKIYKNKIMNENDVKFPEKVTLGEDGMFNIEFFSNATSMKYINYAGYHYREVTGSATRNIVNNVMSYIYIYFTPSKDVSFSMRYKYVKNMIRNKYVREALSIYCSENYSKLGRYEKAVINMIRKKSAIGLYCAVAYSRFRSK